MGRIHRKRTLLVIGGAVVLATVVVLLTAVNGRPIAHSVALTWNAPAPVEGVAITGYNIYRSTAAGGPYVPIVFHVGGTAYKDGLVSGGRTYYYVITSVDSAGHESAYSKELQTEIP